MKTNVGASRYMWRYGAMALIIAAGLALPRSIQAQCVLTSDGTGNQCFALLAGQSIDVGSVCVEVVEDALTVTYTTVDGWELTEAHMWIGNVLANLPQNRPGNPVPGQFPNNSGDISGSTSYTFTVPLSSAAIAFACPGEDVIYYLAAHAAVRKANGDGTYQQETGWSEGSPITTKGNWATFSTFTLTCDCSDDPPPPPPTACDTAFAYSEASVCFSEFGLARWGWTTPVTVGTTTLDLYAGAGQCDLTKGIKVGTLTVIYAGTTMTVTYTLDAGFTMNETQLYVGATPVPTMTQGKKVVTTVAPGQYPYKHNELSGVTTDTYTITVSGSPVYVIAHAVVCD